MLDPPNGTLGDLLMMVILGGAWTFETVGKLLLPVESEVSDTWVARPALRGDNATLGTPAINKEEGMTIFGGECCKFGVLVLDRF